MLTSINTRTRALVWSLVVTAAGSVASAQFVTPPPASNPDPDKIIPKAPVQTTPPPATQPAAAAPKVERAKPQHEPIPNLPFKEWEKDASGNLIPLTEPLELAALRRNPLVTPDTMMKIEAYVPDRRKSMERVVIENLDLVERIDQGLFEQANFNDKKSVGEVVTTTKPLTTPSFASELKNRQIIDDKAFGLNSRITTAYTKAAMPAKKDGMSPDDVKKATMQSMGAIYKQGFIEHVWTYNELIDAASKQMADIKTDAPKAERLATAKASLSKMPLEDRKAMLRKISGYAKPAEAAPAAGK